MQGICCCVPMSYFYSETNIERLSEEMSTALVSNNFYPISLKLHLLITALNLQSIKTLLSLKLSQYSKTVRVVARFPQVSRLLPSVTAAD